MTDLPRAPSLQFADHALASRLEQAEAMHLASAAELYGSIHRELAPTLLRVAGGIAAYLGPTIQLSRSVGLGMNGAVSATELDTLEAFYRGRCATAKILVSSHADPTLLEVLGASGFRLLELDTVLARAIDAGERFEATPTRVATAEEGAVWVGQSIAAFSESDEPIAPGAHARIYETLFTMPTTTYFYGTIDGAPAATGAIDIQGTTAQIFAASTLPSSRGRGLQRALIVARLAQAQAAGCDLAFMRTLPGSASQRNAERLGFRPVYARASMSKTL